MSLEPSTQMARKRHELLADLVDHAERVLVESEVSPERAAFIANQLADHFAQHWGGQVISFPMDYRWQLDTRYLAIYDRHLAGASYGELAMQFKISERHVRTVLATVRKRLADQARKGPPGQGDIFVSDEAS
ncbi:Mor transcription activator family protein [Variovorax sp.]|uniref:Mor transcription activator family protein n=1 Tax=Variovorax sp. TaxID=1871043 RepID=UPI003BA94646